MRTFIERSIKPITRQAGSVVTIPSQLSILRIFLTFIIIALLFTSGPIAKLVALACFMLACLTDWLDGFLARRWNQTSALGALLDPIADKILVLGTFLVFVILEIVPLWIFMVIFLREIIVTGVRLYAASRHIVLAAEAEGKQKAFFQMVTIGVIISIINIEELVGLASLSEPLMMFIRWTVLISLALTVILTIGSGVSFFVRHWRSLINATNR